jgi:hypothetical protein
MKKVFALPKPELTATDFSEFSPAVVGQRYKKRLNEIYAQRHDINLAFSTDG